MRRPTPKRKSYPDPKYHSIYIGKFINYIMKKGKKNIAQKVVYGCFDTLKEKTKMDPLDIFDSAVRNIAPEVEVRSRRIGGANYQIPVPVSSTRKFSLALHWIIEAAKGKKGLPMKDRLAQEILDAYNKTGVAMKKKENVYRMAEANRAFAHFGRYSR